MTTPIGTIERISSERSDEVLELLLNSVQGPAEAYAVLILIIYRLNFEFTPHPLTLVELADAVSKSIASIKKAPAQ